MQQLALWDEYLRRRENRWRVWGGAALLCLFFMVATPKIPHSPSHHLFADMRNFLGVPNTLNVLTSFPLLVIGVIGFVLCLHGNCFGISVKGEVWGWAFFYAAVVGFAFGSAYYHLKPGDARVLWERFSMMIAIASLFSTLVIERINERLGLTCLFSLMLLVLGSIVYERTFNDLRLCMTFIFIPSIAIPTVAFMFSPKYTHSRHWYWASGIYLLAKFEAMADMKVYTVNHYIISGHSLEHLILALVPVLLTAMLWCRNIKIASCKECASISGKRLEHGFSTKACDNANLPKSGSRKTRQCYLNVGHQSFQSFRLILEFSFKFLVPASCVQKILELLVI